MIRRVHDESQSSKNGQRRPACDGYALNGQRCRRLAQPGRAFCATHDRAAEIGLPPYATCNGGRTNLWIYHCMGSPRWNVGHRGPSGGSMVFRCLATGAEYVIQKFVAEGSYGAVYDCSHVPAIAQGLQGVQGAQGAQAESRVALKACKNTFDSRRMRNLEGKDMMYEDDYVRELFVMQVAHDRLVANGGKDEVVVGIVQPLLIKTSRGLHGCIAMERMDGNLADLYDGLEGSKSKNCSEALRFWALCCRFVASSLRQLHERGVYHLDIKPSNLLYRRTRGLGRGFELRLVDFGLGGYLPFAAASAAAASASEPETICRATGTYLPPEWRDRGDKRRPTFAVLKDPLQLEMGEAYAMCKSCAKMYEVLHPSIREGRLAKKLPGFRKLVDAVDVGRQDGCTWRVRMHAGCVRAIEAAADAAVRELDSALSTDGDEAMAAYGFPFSTTK